MKILVIPDCQVKPGHSTNYLTNIGRFIIDKKPDVIVQIGDFADMPSLSSYDKGTKAFEGRRYRTDVESVHQGMEALLAPLEDYNRKARHVRVIGNVMFHGESLPMEITNIVLSVPPMKTPSSTAPSALKT
jgi:hypothetical protein